MPKCVPLVSVDIDAQIRKLLLCKQPVRQIVKTLSVSSKRVCRVRLELLNGDAIQKKSASSSQGKHIGNRQTEENKVTPEDSENLRKSVEYKALDRLNDMLDNDHMEVRDINGILAQVGEKPKAQGDTVTMIFASIGNMAIQARQLLIEEAKRQSSIIDTKPLPDNPDEHDDTLQQDIKP